MTNEETVVIYEEDISAFTKSIEKLLGKQGRMLETPYIYNARIDIHGYDAWYGDIDNVGELDLVALSTGAKITVYDQFREQILFSK